MNRKLNMLSGLVVLNILSTLAWINFEDLRHRALLDRLDLRLLSVPPAVNPASFLDQLRRIYGQKLYSQSDEETLIRFFFKDKREGFFVDVCAGDYQRDSMTFYLEKHLDWKGIATDDNEVYVIDYAKHRPHTRFVRGVVTDGSDPEISKEIAWNLRRIIMPVITLNKLLEDEQVKTIDFLSMNMGLGDPAALKGFDINRFRPKLVCIAAIDHVSNAKSLLKDYFRRNGYERVEEFTLLDRANWYFAPAGNGRRVRRVPGQ